MSWLYRQATRLDTFGAKSRRKRFTEGWPSRTSSEVQFFTGKYATYRYRERGEGQTIVFTADPPVTLEMYDELIELFSKDYRVIVVELAGMGFSAPHSNFSFTWREFNDDVAGFCREVAGERAVLAFSCVAGLAAVDIASRYPELVQSLVLMQTGDVDAFQRWKASRDPKGLLGRPFIGQILMKRLAPKRMPDWFRLSVGKKSKVTTFCDCAAESFEHGALWSLASAYQSYLTANIELERPSQPILALWGLADKSHPVGNEHSVKNFSDNVLCRNFSALGHFSELEDPDQIFAEIHLFLQGNRTK